MLLWKLSVKTIITITRSASTSPTGSVGLGPSATSPVDLRRLSNEFRGHEKYNYQPSVLAIMDAGALIDWLEFIVLSAHQCRSATHIKDMW